MKNVQRTKIDSDNAAHESVTYSKREEDRVIMDTYPKLGTLAATIASQQREPRMLRWPPNVIPVARGQPKLLPMRAALEQPPL